MVFTVVDIETTGLSKHYHQITEIAAARLRNGKITKTFQSLVNPETKIPDFITRLTGIDNEMVKGAPVIKDVMPKFQNFLGENVLVAHCATFDYGFLDTKLRKHYDIGLDNDRLCTRKLANRIIPDLKRKRLTDLCQYFNIKNTQAHRAMSDVNATAEVFTNMLDLLKDKGITEVKDILKFEKSPRKK